MQPIRCRFVAATFITAVFAIAVAAHAQSAAKSAENSQEAVLASFVAPDHAGWLAAERWKEETHDGQIALRLGGGAGYARMKLAGKLPEQGIVMLRLHYYSFGKPISAGIGMWGSPLVSGLARPQGWQTEELVFPAAVAHHYLIDGAVSLIFADGGPTGPTFSSAELIAPTPEHALSAFKAWVRKGTDDAFEAARAKPFVERPYAPAAVALDATAADQSLGAMPFLRSYVEYIYPEDIPAPAERAVAGQIAMPPGEYDVFQFAIHALKDFDQLSADIEGTLPEGIQADIRWVECAPLRFGGSRSNNVRVVPNRLWPRDIFPTCSAKAAKNQAWYAIIRTADTVKPGQYSLKIAVKNAGKQLLTFTLGIKALPFRLPPSAAMDKLFLVTDSGPIEDEPTLEDMFEHGLNATATFDDFRPVSGDNNNVDFTFWDNYFATLKAHHLNNGFFWYLGNPTSGNAVKRSVGNDKWQNIISGLNQRVKDGGYPHNWFLSVDESVRSGLAFGDHKDLFAQCRKDAPALRVLGCALDQYSNTVKYEGVTDMLACNGSVAEDSKWCQEKQVLLNIYSSVCFCAASAGDNRLRYGFFAYQYNSYAMNGWALRWYNGHPYNGLDAGVTDWATFFPNWTGGKPISTPCWEGLRQGINDQRYMAVLESLVKSGKSDGKLLADIRANGVGNISVMHETVVGQSDFGASMKNASNLEIARARVIEEILKASR